MAKEDDLKTMKGHVERAMERERNVQRALEEQREVSNLLREQISQEQAEVERGKKMVAERDGNIGTLRNMYDRELAKTKKLQSELEAEFKLCQSLREQLSEQGGRLRSREEDIESLEVALNDLKDSMVKELE